MSTMSVLVFLLLSISMSSLIHGTHGGGVGDYITINNVADPHIQDIAKFAVSKHNSDSKSNFIFQMIVSGKYQVVAGTNYVLNIEVKDGAKLSNYEAKVFKSLKGNMQLNDFQYLGDIPGGYNPIKDLAFQHYQDIAKFAVSKHNKDTASNLIYQNIVAGESQVVKGTNYLLKIEAKDGIKLSHYRAKVFESLKGDLTLIDFQPILEKKMKPVSSEWKPVENLEKDTHILEIARNAVLEHNKELAKDDDVLVFEKVLSGETQAVDHEGVKYRLVISANGAKFEALAWEKVTSFKPLP